MNDRTDDRKIAFYDGHVRTALDPHVADALLTPPEQTQIVVVGETAAAGTGADTTDADLAVPAVDDGVDMVDRSGDDITEPQLDETLEAPDVADVTEPTENIGVEEVAAVESGDQPEVALDPAFDGGSFDGSPACLGEKIPDGHGGTTPVTDIASIRDGRGNDVGWAYRGGNGDDYFEPSPDSNRAAAVGVAMEVTAWHGGTDDHSGVRALQSGDIRAGDTVHGMNGPSSWLDLTKLGYTPHQTMTLGEGSQATGKILAVTDSEVIQNAGRGVVYVHPRDAFYDATPAPGDKVTVTNDSGRLQTFSELERPQDLDRPQERGPRT